MPNLAPLIDTHAHLDFSEFDQDRAELFLAMAAANIHHCIIPGVAADRWDKQLSVARQFHCTYALGIHPWWANSDWRDEMDKLRQKVAQLADDRCLVAIGECGLDRLRNDNWAYQQPLLEAQLQLADEYSLPVILHCVKAHDTMQSILSQYRLKRKGVIHAFYGSVEVAKRYVALGFKLGIGGLLLDEKATKLQQVVAQLPLESFVTETDAPSMSPPNATDKRNSPLILGEILCKMAKLQKKTDVLISERLLDNATQLFER